MENLSFDITAELKGLNRTLDKASSNIEGFAKKNEARFKAFGESTKKLGKQLSMSLTAPLALLAGNSVRVFADFDDQMRKVGATSGATETQLKQLTDTAKELGQTTRFSAREAGKGLEFMALAGYNTEESISAIPDVLNLAAAAAIELGTAADIVTDTMSAFGIEAEKAGLVSDVFAKTQSSANTSVLQLGEAFKLSSANASSFGTDLETASAILGKFADSGIKGSQAGTTFNGILRDLKASAEDGSVAINGQNVALADSEGNFRDILDIMQDVEGATKDLTEMQKSQALEAIFQQQSIRGVNILMQQGVGASKDLREELYKAGGTAKQMAEQMEGGLGGAMRNLNSAFEGFSIQIGEILAPLVQKFASLLQRLLNYFNDLSPTTQKVIVAIGGLVAAIGPLLISLGFMVSTIIPALITGFSVLMKTIIPGVIAGIRSLTAAMAANPIGFFAVAITTLTTAIYYNWDTIKKWAKDIENYFIKIYNESIVFRASIEYVIFYLKSLFEVGKFVFASLWKVIKTYVNLISGAFTSLSDIIAGAFSFDPKAIGKGLADLRTGLIKTGAEAVAELSRNAKELFDNVAEAGKNMLDKAISGKRKLNFDLEDFKKNLDWLENGIYKAFKNGASAGLAKGMGGRKKVESVGNVESQGFDYTPKAPLIDTENINRDFEGITEAMLNFQDRANDIINGGLTDTFSGLGEMIGNSLSGAENGLENMGSFLLGTLGNLLQQLGQQAIALGFTLEAVKKALTSFGGLGAIAAGVAAIAVGKAFSNSAAKMGKGLGSGGFSGATGASAGGQTGGTRTSVTSTIQNREIILRARGRDLVAVLNQESNFGNIVGG